MLSFIAMSMAENGAMIALIKPAAQNYASKQLIHIKIIHGKNIQLNL